MATKITRELFLSFPYIVLVQDKVLFTQIPASSSPLLLSWWWGVCPVGEVVQVIPATFVKTTYHDEAELKQYYVERDQVTKVMKNG